MMNRFTSYTSPVGKMIMAADGQNLVGLWFERQKYYPDYIGDLVDEGESEVFRLTARWLDVYFSGAKPDFTPPIKMRGTVFQKEIWEYLRLVPYGQTATYRDIAAMYCERHGGKNMAPQAVGGAVGRNPISIIIPCHRIVGCDGKLTGYAGGIDKKQYLLRLEKAVFEGRILVE